MIRPSQLSFRLAVALLALGCICQAQRGPGSVGGGSSVGGGLSGGGRASGVSVKDDLKDFHEALALQATGQQVSQFQAMVNSAEAAGKELKNLERAATGNDAKGSPLALEQSIEKARDDSRKFLDGLSDQQKTGLREVIRRLSHADGDLAQQARQVDQLAGAGAAALASAARNLDAALAGFRAQQQSLGEAMSILSPAGAVGTRFLIPTVRTSIKFQNQSLFIPVSGSISEPANNDGPFEFEASEDLTELQGNIAGLLRGHVEKGIRCGDRISLVNAILTPASANARLALNLHYEHWGCFGAAANEIAEGEAAMDLKLTPSAADGTLRLAIDTTRIEAQEMIQERLRSGTAGDELRSEIAETLLAAMQQAANAKTLLPPAAQDSATLTRAAFDSTGSGRLILLLVGEIKLNAAKAIALNAQLKGQALEQARQ
ncbi:MAG TPA: hypothetical protein VND65_00420 [Candidatus Binatia bacterium]|nr:hypothetical protein [Candidatus Binatia bacterium]